MFVTTISLFEKCGRGYLADLSFEVFSHLFKHNSLMLCKSQKIRLYHLFHNSQLSCRAFSVQYHSLLNFHCYFCVRIELRSVLAITMISWFINFTNDFKIVIYLIMVLHSINQQ